MLRSLVGSEMCIRDRPRMDAEPGLQHPIGISQPETADLSIGHGASQPTDEPTGIPGVGEAVVLRPTTEEFRNVLEYLKSAPVLEAGKQTGIVKLIPPEGWTPPESPTARLDSTVRLETRKQEVHKLTECQDWKSADFFANADEYRAKANEFKRRYFGDVDCSNVERIEKEYWRAVAGEAGQVTVHYAADLDNAIAPYHSVSGQDDATLAQSWSLRAIAQLPGSFLQHLPQHISGVSQPWTYLGMLFSTFCWHNEDLWFPSINYLHQGDPKVWYGIPGEHAPIVPKVIEEEKTKAQSRMTGSTSLTVTQVFGLHNLVHPTAMLQGGASVYSAVQQAGQFIVTFPAAYHAGFSTGWNCAEAVNFAHPSWLPTGRKFEAVRRGKAACLSIDELIIRTADWFHTRRLTHQVKAIVGPCEESVGTFYESLSLLEQELLDCLQPELVRMSQRLQAELQNLKTLWSNTERSSVSVPVSLMSLSQRRALVNVFACIQCDRLCFLALCKCECAASHLDKRRGSVEDMYNSDLSKTQPYRCLHCAINTTTCHCDPSQKTVYLRASASEIEDTLKKGALWLTRRQSEEGVFKKQKT
eukprot:TRINITY_DN9627_c0_g1_i3.p1 TRINITY_DN9627_c0_g1~~TRINITY_DN9627_c0_g1_i3.p1  ORF type:complete len:586 (-),score=122.54 TRINITY_DN9627_c0_g1_i3:491-2248(-)